MNKEEATEILEKIDNSKIEHTFKYKGREYVKIELGDVLEAMMMTRNPEYDLILKLFENRYYPHRDLNLKNLHSLKGLPFGDAIKILRKMLE